MTSQKYRDVTFVCGPPSGDRYEMLKCTALENDVSFSSVYQEYMDRIFEALDEECFFDKIFSSILDQTVKVNRVFPTYQFWSRRQDRFKKFYLSPDDQTAEIPAIMIFPPEFTDELGSEFSIPVEMKDVTIVSAIIGESLKLDWVQVKGVFVDEVN